MAIILRSVKGSNLTAAEVDGNFEDLDGRVIELETNPPQPEEITNITLTGSQLTIHLSSGEEFGPFTVPFARINWRGDWLPSTLYQELDIVKVSSEGVFLVVAEHVSDTAFDPDEQDSDGDVYAQLFGADTHTQLSEIGDVEYTGDGPVEDDILVWDGTTDGNWVHQNRDIGTIYDFGCAFEDEPTGSTVITRVRIGRDIAVTPDFVGSYGGVEDNPNVAYVITIAVDDVPVGAINITTGGVVTFEAESDFDGEIDAGSEVTFIAPDDESDGATDIRGGSFLVAARVR